MLVVMRQDATAEEIEGVVRAIEARGFKAHPIPGAQRTAIGITGQPGGGRPAGVREPARRPRGHPGHPRLQARVPRGEAGGHGRPGGRRAGGREGARDRGRAVRGRVARADAHRGARGEGGGGPAAARRRLQAPHQPLLLPGARRGGAADPGRRAGGDRAAGGDRGARRRGRRPRRALRRLHPDRRPQHAELLAAEALRAGEEAGAPEARPGRDARGVPDVGRVHPGRGELRRDPVRARGAHLLGLLAQHPRPRGGAGGEALSHLPILVDPSHGTGRRDKVAPMSRGAAAVGADGLIVEVHHDPDTRALRRPAVDHARRRSPRWWTSCGRSRRSSAGLCL